MTFGSYSVMLFATTEMHTVYIEQISNPLQLLLPLLRSAAHCSLLSVCYKLLERLALQRISPTVEGLLSPDQADFRKDRSTCDQVAALATFIENGFQQ